MPTPRPGPDSPSVTEALPRGPQVAEASRQMLQGLHLTSSPLPQPRGGDHPGTACGSIKALGMLPSPPGLTVQSAAPRRLCRSPARIPTCPPVLLMIRGKGRGRQSANYRAGGGQRAGAQTPGSDPARTPAHWSRTGDRFSNHIEDQRFFCRNRNNPWFVMRIEEHNLVFAFISLSSLEHHVTLFPGGRKTASSLES